jgi:hypothetical protein
MRNEGIDAPQYIVRQEEFQRTRKRGLHFPAGAWEISFA